ncbi:hypothetical protein PG993_000725 [Apiospora rasikravindrae]|uniref:Uncharacterized protein n=1 Tax=Apiospora rasikravindrae TaxID=990691 RepID=A0ABR1U9D7_9PEZI
MALSKADQKLVERVVAFVYGGALKSYGSPMLQRLKIENKASTNHSIYKYYKRSSVDDDWGQIEYAVRVTWLDVSWTRSCQARTRSPWI